LLTDSKDKKETADITYNEEALRKGLHAFTIIIPLVYYFIPRSAALIILLVATVLAVILDLSRMTGHSVWTKFGVHLFGKMVRPRERERFTGASYILSTDFLVVLMFDKPVAICAIAFIALGDTAAAMVGRRWGKHKFGRKSVEGSLGFLITASAIAVFFNQVYGNNLPLLVGLSGALVATLVEAMSIRSDDNLTVPIVAGLYMQVFLAFL
jgi:dolichol kinase